jgi:hypothetical protein
MEARELIDEVILQKPSYGGRSLEPHRLAQRPPELCAGEDDGLLAVLDEVFAEQARHLPLLFDLEAPGVALKPSAPAIKRRVALLSATETFPHAPGQRFHPDTHADRLPTTSAASSCPILASRSCHGDSTATTTRMAASWGRNPFALRQTLDQKCGRGSLRFPGIKPPLQSVLFIAVIVRKFSANLLETVFVILDNDTQLIAGGLGATLCRRNLKMMILWSSYIREQKGAACFAGHPANTLPLRHLRL